MTGIAPGWYKDPAEPDTQRYWDGEGWIGEALPADVEPPPGPPEVATPPGEPTLPAPVSVVHPVPLQARDVRPEPPGPVHPPSATTRPSGAQSPPGARPPRAQPPGPHPPPGQRPPYRYGQPAPGPRPPYRYGQPAPTPRPHGLVLAPPGARLVARLIDIAVVTGLALVANAWFLYQLGREFGALYAQVLRQVQPGEDVANRVNTLVVLISIVSAATWLAYEVPAIANTGQTLGKRVLGIKVVPVEAPGRIGFGRAFGRWSTLGLPTLLWPCCGVGLVMQLVDCLFVVTDRPLHQALHDKRAQTVVVHVGQVSADPRKPGEPGKPDGGMP